MTMFDRFVLQLESCIRTKNSVIIRHEDAEWLLNVIQSVDKSQFEPKPATSKTEKRVHELLHSHDISDRQIRLELHQMKGTVLSRIKQLKSAYGLDNSEMCSITGMNSKYFNKLMDGKKLTRWEITDIRLKLGMSIEDMQPYTMGSSKQR